MTNSKGTNMEPIASDYADYWSSEQRYLEDFLVRKHGTLKDIENYLVERVSAGEKYSRTAFEIHLAKAASKVIPASEVIPASKVTPTSK